jgi:predicted ester cyclase
MGQLGLFPGAYRPVDPPAPATPPAAEPTLDRTGSQAAVESDNAAVVRTLAALVGSHERAPIVALYRPDAVLDDISTAAPAAGAPGIDKSYAELFTAFPDLAMTDVDVVSAGAFVVATYKLTGTHGGPYPRLRAKSGTMRQIDLEVAALFHLQDGKIARHTIFVDGMAAAIQLGLFDIPGAPPPAADKPAKPPKG